MSKRNTSYTLQGRIRIPALTNASAQVIIFYYNAAGGMVGSETSFEYASPTEWMTFGFMTSTPASAVKARVHLHLQSLGAGASGIVDFDSIRMIVGNRVELIGNGEFETYTAVKPGVADHWSWWAQQGITPQYELTTAKAASGKWAQKMSANGFDGGFNVFQDSALQANKSYMLSGKVNIESLANAGAQVIVYYFDRTGAVLASEKVFDRQSATTGWTGFEGRLAPPMNAVRALVHLHVQSSASAGAGTVCFDSISLAAVNS